MFRNMWDHPYNLEELQEVMLRIMGGYPADLEELQEVVLGNI